MIVLGIIRTVEDIPRLQHGQIHPNAIAFARTKWHKETFQQIVFGMCFIPTVRQKLVRLTDVGVKQRVYDQASYA